MTQEEILRQIASLPPEGQQQVVDFIAFLHQRYGLLTQARESHPSDLAQDSFIGMWQDREEMQDSSAWVRSNREHEWVKRSG
jgi:hypothetical protein